jgi:hypothetical protein
LALHELCKSIEDAEKHLDSKTNLALEGILNAAALER